METKRERESEADRYNKVLSRGRGEKEERRKKKQRKQFCARESGGAEEVK